MASDHVGWQGELSTQVIAGLSGGHGRVMGASNKSERDTLSYVFLGSPHARGWPGLGEPQCGTDIRSTLMDALRPHAEWMLGKPVEF